MIAVRRLTKGALISLLLMFATACGTGSDVNESIAAAKQYFENNDLNAASLELKNILRDDAKHAESRYLLGKINLRLGDTKAAQKELRRAIDAGWDEASANLLIAEALFRQGDFQALIDDVPIKDSYPAEVRANLLGLRATAEMGLGKWDAAEETIKSGLSINKKVLWIMQSNIRWQLHRDENAAAMGSVLAALKVHPKSQDLWMIKAGLAEQEGKLEVATTALQKTIELEPLRNITFLGRQARLALSQLWMRQNNFEEAKKTIEPVLSSYTNDPLANYTVALITFRNGEYDAAEKHLTAVLRVAPEHRQSLLLFGALNYAKQDFRQAAVYLEKAAAAQPDDVGTQTLLGKTYLMLGQFDDAQKRLEYASTMADDDAELLALVGLSKLKGGDAQSGIQELEKAAAAAPTDTAIRSELARAYISIGKTSLAVKELESVLEGSQQEHKTQVLLLMAYLQSGEFDKAMGIADTLISEVPGNPLPYYFAGIVYEAKQDFAAASNSYQKALDVDAKNVLAQLGLARLDIQAGKIDGARGRYEKILKTNADNPQALLGLAKIIGKEGAVEKAVKLVEQAREKNPAALEPRMFLAEYFFQKNDFAEAMLMTEEATALAPGDPRVMALLGRMQLSMNQGEKALKTLNALVVKTPNWTDAHFLLSKAQVFVGDISAAKASLKKTVLLDPTYTAAQIALGNIELRTGNMAEALNIAQHLQKTKDSEAKGYLLEGDIYMASKKPAQATIAYQKAFEYSPTTNVALKRYTSVKSEGKPDDALRSLEKWLNANPQDGAVRQFLASVYQSNGDDVRAMREYEKVLAQYPNSVTALNNLAGLYYKIENDKQRSVELARQAHKLAPENVAVLDTYGWLLVETGSLEQGMWLLNQAAKATKNETVHYHFAVSLARTGDKTTAVEELKAILASDGGFPERSEAEALLKALM